MKLARAGISNVIKLHIFTRSVQDTILPLYEWNIIKSRVERNKFKFHPVARRTVRDRVQYFYGEYVFSALQKQSILKQKIRQHLWSNKYRVTF